MRNRLISFFAYFFSCFFTVIAAGLYLEPSSKDFFIAGFLGLVTWALFEVGFVRHFLRREDDLLLAKPLAVLIFTLSSILAAALFFGEMETLVESQDRIAAKAMSLTVVFSGVYGCFFAVVASHLKKL